jgi:glutamate/aspartate transport system substrate-binding protein
MFTYLRAAGLIGLLAAAPLAPAKAVEGDLSPALAAMKQRHAVRIGYRESSVPFSFLDRAQRPVGYSIELCEAIAAAISAEIDEPNLAIGYVKVTAETRIKAVTQDEIDFECGSTTANAERSKLVAFSPLIFVAGTKLMVRRDSKIAGAEDLRGKTVVVTAGTTNEAVIRALDQKQALGLTIVTAPDHEQSYQLLADGKADAFATDDVLLYGLIAKHKTHKQFEVTADYLSYEPYGIMYKKDDAQLKAVVEAAFRNLATNRDLIPLYKKWFTSRLPTGEKLDIALSPQLEESFKILDESQSGTN